MKILANDGISSKSKLELEKEGFIVITEKVNQDDLIEVINKENYEGILVRSATKIRQDIIDGCPGIKFIGRGGVGMDNIDVNYAREKGIFVFNTPASSSQSVAELVIGLMFGTSRFIGSSSRNIESGDFNKLKKEYGSGIELRGKTLGIIGFGRIGQTLASYAIGIGMDVVAIDIEEKTVGVSISSEKHKLTTYVDVKTDINEILPICDYISVHVPKQEGNKPVIGKSEFELMKDGVILINTSRGGVIDEEELIKNLDSGKVFSAGLDVFENEPNPNKELLSHPKIISTPHIGAATNEAQGRIGDEIVKIIIDNFKQMIIL
jgi:D-3-phosphoglycerate dehydrogenase